MAKIIDYPRASFKSCLEVAGVIDSFGGKCSSELAADKLGRRLSGAWQAQIASTIKFGLISSAKGMLAISTLYRDYKLAYTDQESKAALSKAFLLPPIFKQITDRFEGIALPSHFEKFLIKELHVPEEMASRVAKYYIEGAKLTGILSADGLVNASSPEQQSTGLDDQNAELDENNIDEGMIDAPETPVGNRTLSSRTNEKLDLQVDTSLFSVRISGPGMDSLITINEPEDLLIVNAMLKKIEKQLKNNELKT